MQKYILTAILISNTVLLMGQNINQQTNILAIQTRSGNSENNRNWLSNESDSNRNKPVTNRNNAVQTQARGNMNVSNENNQRQVNRNPGNNRQTTRNINPAPQGNVNPLQIQSQVTNLVIMNTGNEFNQESFIANEDNNPVFSNGNLNINEQQVQNKQIQFLADNNSENLQLVKPGLNFEFNIEQKTQVKTTKIKTDKIKTSVTTEIKTVNLKVKENSSESRSKELTSLKNKSSVAEKHKGNSSYSQKHKSYVGKKIKIWCQKNLRFAKKIRMSVSCPKF